MVPSRYVPVVTTLLEYGSHFNVYRRRWGCAAAVQLGRLKVARASYVTGGAAEAALDAEPGGFDPRDHVHFDSAAAPTVAGAPAGQGRRTGLP